VGDQGLGSLIIASAAEAVRGFQHAYGVEILGRWSNCLPRRLRQSSEGLNTVVCISFVGHGSIRTLASGLMER
jgi:hypothetical protein